MRSVAISFSFFFFNDTATTEIYTLSLHDALPISQYGGEGGVCFASGRAASPVAERREVARSGASSARGPVAALFLALLRVYQGCLSPLMPSACKFYPSCSHYAYHAIELHGARRGGWLALLRLRSEEHTSELQSRLHLVCRLLLEKKKKTKEEREDGNQQGARHTALLPESRQSLEQMERPFSQ